MFLDNMKKSDCCGCMACSKICNISAIKMQQDKKGFYYPVVNKNKCVNCGRCELVCPMQENYVGQDAAPDCYAVRNRDMDVLKRSSSGGMFSLLAEWVLLKEGVIYGVAFDEGFYVHHTRATTIETAKKICSSKYVESDLTEVYESILEDLKEEKIVLLTGTPCQISAITKYLMVRKVNIENLYTCDNICHGVPSQKIWASYLDILKKQYIASDDEIVYINMRSKKDSWQNKALDIRLRKGNINKVIQKFSFNRFYQSLYGTRDACFYCRYTSYKRCSDFTVGDFWNVEHANISFDITGGVNVVLVNTEKGRILFQQICQKADTQKVEKKTCWQPHLEYSSKKPSKQNEFWKEYIIARDKEVVLRKYMQGSVLTKIIRIITPFLHKTGLYGLAGKVYKIVLVERRR